MDRETECHPGKHAGQPVTAVTPRTLGETAALSPQMTEYGGGVPDLLPAGGTARAEWGLETPLPCRNKGISGHGSGYPDTASRRLSLRLLCQCLPLSPWRPGCGPQCSGLGTGAPSTQTLPDSPG